MTEPATSTSSAKLDAAIVAFVQALERGETPDRAALLSRHADIAAELAEFFADHDRLRSIAGTSRTPSTGSEPTELLTPGLPGSADVTWRPPSGTGNLTLGQIGHYQILQEIGRGGMGVVYRAQHRELGREVALKTTLGGPFASHDDRLRFQTEAVAAAKLNHKGIVPVFEVGEANGQPFFAMPLVEGQTLADRLRDGPLSPATAARLLQQIASAVAYAHSHGVIHRDLKPSNILLQKAVAGSQKSEARASDLRPPTSDLASSSPDLHPLISDFGLAKCLSDSDDLTVSGQIVGTPSYMCPEQASGRRHEVGPAADIYSLGAILYAMLTGVAPFYSDNPVEVILQVIEREPPLPSSLRGGLPRELEWICLKCLEKKPANRYASAAELAEDLDRFLRHEPPLAQRPTIGQRARRWIRRKPVLAAHFIGLATPLLVGQLVFAFHQRRDVEYHLNICGVLLFWMAASTICQWLIERQRTHQWPLYLWAAADTLLLTTTLSFMVPPRGIFIGAYLLLIAISGLASSTRLVAFTTVSSMLSLVFLFLLRPEETPPLHYAIFVQMTFALCGLAVGYQLWRMNVLREYYGDRPAG